MYNKRYLNIKVACPGEPFKIQDVQVILMQLEDGSWFPAPCSGCNSMNDLKPCHDCCAALTLMFFHEPDMDISQPINPRFPSAK